MYSVENERKLSRRRRKKMAKVQQRKQNREFRQEKFHRTAIYKHLIRNTNSVRILEYLASGFEQELFLASLNNLSDKGNPLRFNNFAYCMREIITLILAKYSSDEDILNCCWYKNETDKDSGVTRAQRAKYAIQGGFNDEMVFEILQLDAEEEKDLIKDTLTQFTKLFRELNEHTHLREKRFNIGDILCESLAFQLLSVMDSILTLIEDLREQIKSYVEGEIDDSLVSEFVNSTFNELDILSTHTSVDYSEINSYHVECIYSKHV